MPVPCPQVAEYVWHRRGLLALNLSRVDFLLGESLHPRVPWHQLGALGDPWPVLGCWGSCSGQLSSQGCCCLQGMVAPGPGDAGSPQNASIPLRMLVFPPQRSCYLPGDAGTPK